MLITVQIGEVMVLREQLPNRFLSWLSGQRRQLVESVYYRASQATCSSAKMNEYGTVALRRNTYGAFYEYLVPKFHRVS